MDYIVFFAVGIILLFLVAKVLVWPLKFLGKLIINAVLGAVMLLVINFIGGYFGFSIGINIWTALIAGFFGVPGVIFMLVFKFLL